MKTPELIVEPNAIRTRPKAAQLNSDDPALRLVQSPFEGVGCLAGGSIGPANWYQERLGVPTIPEWGDV